MLLSLEKRKFVVQQHKATNEHWDLRLQMGKKMKSWAIPKGPSTDPAVKRLAIKMPDHELSYKDFEGVIDKGLYGAGKVMVWDNGKYKLLEGSIKKGVLKFELDGKKLKGRWALVKTKRGWLLIKERDGFSNKKDIVKMKSKSVKSGKTIDKITKNDGFITKSKDLGF